MAKPVDLNDQGFEEKVLKGAEKPVLVDFWAPWCAPCKMVAPIVEELSTEYDGRVDFYKVNTDENPTVAGRYNVMSIPTLLVFKQGQPHGQVVGFRPKKDLKALLDGALA